MQICDACKSLAGASVRLVRPTHLRPVSTHTGRLSHEAAGTAYQCGTCDGRWYWGFSGSWVLLLPVDSSKPERHHLRRWWISITEAISQLRARRRLRVTRVPFRAARESRLPRLARPIERHTTHAHPREP